MDENKLDGNSIPQEPKLPPQPADVPQAQPVIAPQQQAAGQQIAYAQPQQPYTPQPLAGYQTGAPAQPYEVPELQAQPPQGGQAAYGAAPGYAFSNEPPVKKKKKTGLIVGIVVAVLAIAAAAVCAVLFLNGRSKKAADTDANNLFSQELVSVCKDGKWGYANKKGEIVINCQFDDVGEFTEDGLARVKMNGLYGYIGTDGTFVINPMFASCGNFNYGLAYARMDNSDKYGFIDQTGTMVINPQYDDAWWFTKSGLAVVQVGDYYGLIDKTGKFVVNPQYECSSDYGYEMLFATAALNQDDVLITVIRNGKYGYIDTTGTEVIPCQFDYAATFFRDEKVEVVMMKTKEGLIDRQGKYVLNPMYDDISSLGPNMFSFMEDEESGKVGLVKPDGTIVAQPQFDNVEKISDTLFAVTMGKQVGIVDETGSYVLNPTYDSIEKLHAGLIKVTSNEKYGYVNTTGEAVISPLFDDALDFLESRGVSAVKQSGKWGLIDKEGNFLSDARFDVCFELYDDQYAITANADKTISIVDFDGNVLLGGLEGVAGTIHKICEQKGCFNAALDGEDYCEDHAIVDFNKIVANIDYSSYAQVTSDGHSCLVKSKYYSYSGDYDNGLKCALYIARELGLGDALSSMISGAVNSKTFTYNDACEITITYAVTSSEAAFLFEAKARNSNGSNNT